MNIVASASRRMFHLTRTAVRTTKADMSDIETLMYAVRVGAHLEIENIM